MVSLPSDICACKRNDPVWLAEAERLAERWRLTMAELNALVNAGKARGIVYQGWPLPLDYCELTDALYGPEGISAAIAVHRYGAVSTYAGQPRADSDCTCRVPDPAWHTEHARLLAIFQAWKVALRAVVDAEEVAGISQDARPFSRTYTAVAHAIYGESGIWRTINEHRYGPIPYADESCSYCSAASA